MDSSLHSTYAWPDIVSNGMFASDKYNGIRDWFDGTSNTIMARVRLPTSTKPMVDSMVLRERRITERFTSQHYSCCRALCDESTIDRFECDPQQGAFSSLHTGGAQICLCRWFGAISLVQTSSTPAMPSAVRRKSHGRPV
ncbi:MAG: hypothetical protein R3C56_09130 [Pirellulaceae bacterium]